MYTYSITGEMLPSFRYVTKSSNICYKISYPNTFLCLKLKIKYKIKG